MQIDGKLVSYLEDLSNLTLSVSERSRITSDIQNIVNYMAQLGSLDTNGVPECTHPYDHVNAFRDDIVEPSLDRDLLLQNAPEHNDEAIIAPKTVGD